MSKKGCYNENNKHQTSNGKE
ncbi:hypothetical protein KL86CLO1_10639 [uncultured Eubacteriales bacterium]|uniref:Uncharacterized protein n=1 Tax=uncultured Eubacteriales bacterium TaxID=172733 RepID=A0A212J7F7_9FIRM|nr:hypothetical protein KL86CLO1_10639 [uncultured Eubacteriales bacterium]